MKRVARKNLLVFDIPSMIVVERILGSFLDFATFMVDSLTRLTSYHPCINGEPSLVHAYYMIQSYSLETQGTG